MFIVVMNFFFLVFLVLWLLRSWIAKRSNSVRCLVGKTAIITGGNSGIGYATAVLLASRGCRVIIADKDNAEKSCIEIKKLTNNPNILYSILDLSSLKSVREFARSIKEREKVIDILINNAGIGGTIATLTTDRLDCIMQINYLGHFLLTHLLLEPLKASGSSRVIFTGSSMAFLHKLTPQTLNYTATGSSAVIVRYANSKLCNILAAQEFGKRFLKYGITANSTDPGCIRTQILDKKWMPRMSVKMLLEAVDSFFLPFFGRGAFIGAQTNLYVASSGEMEGKTSGHYFACRPWFKPKVLEDPKYCEAIWRRTEELVMLRTEEKI